MRILLLASALASALAQAGEDRITVLDEARVPLAGVAVEATYLPLNDADSDNMRTFTGLTDQRGEFRITVGPDLRMLRLRARQADRFEADLDHRHGLGEETPLKLEVTLPQKVAGVPLHYREVLLSRANGKLTPGTWVGFDLAVGDVVAPGGRGITEDFRIWNEGRQVGWLADAATLPRLRQEAATFRLSEESFVDTYGQFQGLTRVVFRQPGAGIQRTTAFWPYGLLKMPAEAPVEGYAAELVLPYATLPYPTGRDDFTGFFLRLRPTLGPDGQVRSAHYAKIHGRMECGYGWVRFRYYYNPRIDDRRLVFATERNLLRPAPAARGPDAQGYDTFQR